MTESQFTRKLIRELRIRIPGAWVQKFNDSISSGIPDFCVVFNGATVWFEVKKGTKLTDIQAATLKLIQSAYAINVKNDNSWVITNSYGMDLTCGKEFKGLIDNLEATILYAK